MAARAWIILGALALAACSGDEPTPPDTPGAVAVVNVAVVSSRMVVGATQQLSAKLYDKNGKLVTASTVSWSASPTSVATVSATGLLTAVAPGTVRVTASSGSLSNSVDVLVEANPCSSPISMAVGEVRTFSGGATVACVTLAATTGPSDFVFIAANARPAQDDVLTYQMSLGNVVAAMVSPARVVDDAEPVLPGEREAEALHERLREYERAALSPVVRAAATARAQESLARLAPSTYSAIAAVGDTVTIRVPNLNTGKDICRDNIPVKGVVRALSARATVIADVATPPGGFSASDYNAIALEFDNLIFPVDTSWFGAPTDINSDGRITIFMTPEVNKLTPPSSAGFTAGFFFGSDLIKRSEYPTTNECRNQTNEQEIFYVLVPDPSGTFNNVRSTATVRQGTRGVIAHEFQHMINQGVRQYNPAVQALETFWLNEAMSHFAEEAVGRTLLGAGDYQELTFAQVNPNPTAQNDYNAFFRQNLTRFQRWMARPDTSAPISAKNRDQLAPRGASWALLRYAIDQYSAGAARAFTRALAAGPQTDIANLLARASGAQFDQIITGWLVANYADGLAIPGLPTRYTYPSWNVRDAMAGASNGTFPLVVDPLPGTFPSQALSSSGTYYRLTRAAAGPAVQVKLTAAGGAPLASDFATIAILRVQ